MSALALLAAQALTLAQFDQLPPQAAADRALAEQDHGIVAEVLADPGNGMALPGMTERGLVERAVAVAGGCTRRRWTVSFGGRDGAGPAVQQGAYARTEVARRSGSSCPTTGYVRVNAPLTPAAALAALHRLSMLQQGSRIHFSCRDDTDTGLCRNDRTMQAALRRLPAWAVTPREGSVELWLGTPGDVVTAVRLGAVGAPVAVARYYPPPF